MFLLFRRVFLKLPFVEFFSVLNFQDLLFSGIWNIIEIYKNTTLCLQGLKDVLFVNKNGLRIDSLDGEIEMYNCRIFAKDFIYTFLCCKMLHSVVHDPILY